MIISQIFAKAANDVIGNDNKLPWHLPKDLKFFKAKTLGHPIIMGRKTFESLGKPLPGRTNIVITKTPHYKVEGIVVVHSVEDALDEAKKREEKEILIIGGASIFAETMALTDKIYLTEVKASVPGNITFRFNKMDWKEIFREDHFKDGKHAYDFSFVELIRV
jgi:dihydrofolate reductase